MPSNNRLRAAIAAEVRAELARQDKTHEEIGAVLGLPKQSVAMRLRGRTPFRAEELARIAYALGVSLDRFMPEMEMAA